MGFLWRYIGKPDDFYIQGATCVKYEMYINIKYYLN